MQRESGRDLDLCHGPAKVKPQESAEVAVLVHSGCVATGPQRPNASSFSFAHQP